MTAPDTDTLIALAREGRIAVVKPLEWGEHAPPNGRDCFYDHTRADTPFGTYSIEWKSWKDGDWPALHLFDQFVRALPTVEAAKSAAQADYEQRILSALTPTLTPALLALAEERDRLREALQMAMDHDALDGSPQALEAARRALTEERRLPRSERNAPRDTGAVPCRVSPPHPRPR